MYLLSWLFTLLLPQMHARASNAR